MIVVQISVDLLPTDCTFNKPNNTESSAADESDLLLVDSEDSDDESVVIDTLETVDSWYGTDWLRHRRSRR